MIRTFNRREKICRKKITKDETQSNGWTLKENAESEILEVWEKSSDGEQKCYLTEFYDASDILEKESFKQENTSLEEVIGFFREREFFAEFDEIISFQDCIDAIKKYAEENGADELTKIFAIQMFIVESKLKTKIESYLPTYSEEILSEVEKNPDKIFESANKAQAILKNFRREKIKPIAEEYAVGEVFGDLKIIYHGSQRELKNRFGSTYKSESILKGGSAYEFLFMLKFASRQKIWLEFFYQNYAHGKFLISDDDFDIFDEESVADFLKIRLGKNRKQLLNNSQELKKYVTEGKMIREEEFLNQANIESELFQSAMENFEQEEMKYLESHAELFQRSA